MGTRSTIAIQRDDGTVGSIYCHWDGYLSHNGRILQEHYSDPEKIEKLISLGYISSLDYEIGQTHDENTDNDWVVAYHRDRNEPWEDNQPDEFVSFEVYREDFDAQAYNYIWRGDQWYVSRYESNRWYTMVEAFIMENSEE